MERLIKFQWLSSQLDDTEIKQLIKDICHRLGHQQIISFIFNGFYQKYLQNKVHDSKLQSIIGITSNIINSRVKTEESPAKKKEVKPIKFDAMPIEMIGKCASYLQQSDYLRLSITNRAIYYATNSPNTLQELDVTAIDDYQIVNIDPADFNAFQLAQNPQNQINFDHLIELQIDQCHSNNEEDVDELFDSKL